MARTITEGKEKQNNQMGWFQSDQSGTASGEPSG
jgi:hypothetical protein